MVAPVWRTSAPRSDPSRRCPDCDAGQVSHPSTAPPWQRRFAAEGVKAGGGSQAEAEAVAVAVAVYEKQRSEAVRKGYRAAGG